MSEVERHGGPDEAGQIGRLETILEGPNPLRLRHAPQSVACYNPGNVLTEPGAYQTRVYILGDPPIGINLRIGRIGIGKSIVLIGGKRELAAGNASECKPSPSAGRWSVSSDGEIEKARSNCIAIEREHTPDVGGVKSGLNQCYES